MKSTHVHKYQRFRIGKNKDYVIYKCMFGGCRHYMPADIIIGCESICWRCGLNFTITKTLMHKKPHCQDCVKKRSKVGDMILHQLGLDEVKTI